MTIMSSFCHAQWAGSIVVALSLTLSLSGTPIIPGSSQRARGQEWVWHQPDFIIFSIGYISLSILTILIVSTLAPMHSTEYSSLHVVVNHLSLLQVCLPCSWEEPSGSRVLLFFQRSQCIFYHLHKTSKSKSIFGEIFLHKFRKWY